MKIKLRKFRNKDPKYRRFTHDVEVARGVDIENLFNRFGINLRKKFAICPFHDDKNPSLRVYPKTNSWYCFGCGRGGDTIDFVIKIAKVDFKKAVDLIVNNGL
ncbi:DNA primase [Candidatus Dojkabacteria bacterium]|nr:DNA primase [Candidatus Dojkabacteria bacterium]